MNAEQHRNSATTAQLRELPSGGDRRSIAESNRARAIVERDPSRVGELASLVNDEDWLVSLRALDLLEKFAHDHAEWIEPYRTAFIGPIADSDKWETRARNIRERR